jgi:hypothetical protein
MSSLYQLKRLNKYFFVSFAAIFTLLLLFFFRFMDDNRLFNWQWVFAGNSANKIYLPLICGIFAAYTLSKLSLLERSPGVFLFLSSFLVSTVFWTEPELIMDAARYFTQAKHLEVYGIPYFISEWGKSIVAWTDLPTVPFLYGLIFKFFGESRIFIQIFTALLFSSTLVCTYLIGKKLWNDEIGFAAGILLLGMPYLLTQVPLMLVDVPTMFFLTLSILTFIKALDKDDVLMSLLASIALSLSVFTKYSAWLLLSVLGIIFINYSREDPKAIYRRVFPLLLLSGLLIGLMVVLKFDVISEQIKLLLSYQKPGLDRWGESFLSTFFFQIHPFIPIAATFSLYLAVKNKDFKLTIISWPLVIIFIVGIRRIRYILPIFPLLALMAAYGLQIIRQSNLRKFVIYIIVISSLIITIFGYLPFAREISAINLKEAGEYLNTTGRGPIEVYTLPLKDPVANPSVSVPLLDLFTNRKIAYQYRRELYPAPEDIMTASLRFTWEYKNPNYYLFAPEEEETSSIIVIAGEPDPLMPLYLQQIIQHRRMVKKFATSAGPFRYKTIVEIYSR